MNKLLKIIVSCALTLSVFTTAVFASVLGSIQISGSKLELFDDTYLYKNVFMSDQASVKEQTEFYAEYTPNKDIRPVVINGEQIFGKRNILEAAKYMEENGLQPMLGINADFFSFKTGVPMSHTIMDGEIVTKDISGQDSIGFREDGSAFMSWLEIETILRTEDQSFYIDNINKYRQPDAVPAFLLTDKYGVNTSASTWGIDVILTNIEGDMTIGGEVKAVIEAIGYNDGAIEIPEGKMVLTMDCNGLPELYEQMQNLKVGEEVTITNTAKNDQELWKTAESAIGSTGGRLLNNGVIGSGFEAGSAPRTAVGITADGKVIFYVLDGRQTGHSYGAKIETIAKRMLELGCVDAINLDGGGSTSIAGIYPGSDNMSVINSPSEGSLRKVSNFLFLQNTQVKTGVVNKLHVYPYEGYYLNGMTANMEVKATDTASYPVAVPNDTKYSITHTGSTIDQNGVITFSGNGEVIVVAESDNAQVYGQASLYTYETPTDIIVRNEATKKDITSITGNMNDTFDLTAVAYAGYNILESKDEVYKWSVEGKIGKIDEKGLLTLSENAGATGRVVVTAGEKSAFVDVKIKDVADIEKWPVIYVKPNEEDGTIIVNVTSVGSGVLAEDVIVRVDGDELKGSEEIIERIQFNENYAGVICSVGAEFFEQTHKISVETTNGFGYTSIWNDTIKSKLPQSKFLDMKGHWANSEVTILSTKGYINGMIENGKNYFKPNDVMTRAQFAVMMCNYLDVELSVYENMELEFADNKDIPSWAANAIKAVADKNIMNGRLEEVGVVFAPNATITRSEAATILSRILPEGLYADNLKFTDNDSIPEWSLSAFKRLYTSKIINGYEDNTIRPENSITRAEAAKLLYNIM